MSQGESNEELGLLSYSEDRTRISIAEIKRAHVKWSTSDGENEISLILPLICQFVGKFTIKTG